MGQAKKIVHNILMHRKMNAYFLKNQFFRKILLNKLHYRVISKNFIRKLSKKNKIINLSGLVGTKNINKF